MEVIRLGAEDAGSPRMDVARRLALQQSLFCLVGSAHVNAEMGLGEMPNQCEQIFVLSGGNLMIGVPSFALLARFFKIGSGKLRDSSGLLRTGREDV